MKNESHSKKKKICIVTGLSLLTGGLIALLSIISSHPSSQLPKHLVTLAMGFSVVGIKKIYPHSKWMSIWSFVCVCLTTYSLIGLNNHRIHQNIKSSFSNIIQNEDVVFTQAKHGQSADLLNFVTANRKKNAQQIEIFWSQLSDEGWDNLGWTPVLDIENLLNSESRSKNFEQLLNIIDIIETFKHESEIQMEESVVKVKEIIYQSYERGPANEIWKNFSSLMSEKYQKIHRQIDILMEVVLLNIELVLLIDDCNGFELEDNFIVFYNQDDLHRYENIMSQIEEYQIEFDEISDSVKEEELVFAECKN